MLRFKEWELRDTPLIIPVTKDRNKRGNKKGQGKGGAKRAAGGFSRRDVGRAR
jgi:hypothetical protein